MTPALQQALTQVDRIVLGKETRVRLCLAYLLARGHLLIEDAPGGVCAEGFNGTYKVFLTKTADGKPVHLRFETISDQCFQRETALRMDGKDWVQPQP